jgi:hypothetical protein
MKYYTTEGELKVIGDIQTFANNFKKREVVITIHDEFPEDIKMDFTGDKCKLMDQFNIGDLVVVAFKLKGNEYNGKYYTNLNIIAIGELDESGKKRIKTKPHISEVPDGDDYLDF